ncbi:hypothetical protein [Vibrio phage phiKT1028]|nr:hypothetical protein [Vibrio phage phiKT1028]
MITDLEGNPSNWLRWTIGVVLLCLGMIFGQWCIVVGILSTYLTAVVLGFTTSGEEYALDISKDTFITFNNLGISIAVGLLITFTLHIAGL